MDSHNSKRQLKRRVNIILIEMLKNNSCDTICHLGKIEPKKTIENLKYRLLLKNNQSKKYECIFFVVLT